MRQRPACGTGLSSHRLSCPACQGLAHEADLQPEEAPRAHESGEEGGDVRALVQFLVLVFSVAGASVLPVALPWRAGDRRRRGWTG